MILVVVVCVNPPFGFVMVVVVVVVGVGAFAFAMCIKGDDVTSVAIATIMAAAIITVFVCMRHHFKGSIRKFCVIFEKNLLELYSWQFFGLM